VFSQTGVDCFFELISTQLVFTFWNYTTRGSPIRSSPHRAHGHLTLRSASIHRHSERAMLDVRGRDPRNVSYVHLRMACSHGGLLFFDLKPATTPVWDQLPCSLLTTCGSHVQTPTMVASYIIMKTHTDLYDDMVGYLGRLPLVDWLSRVLVVHLRRTIYPMDSRVPC